MDRIEILIVVCTRDKLTDEFEFAQPKHGREEPSYEFDKTMRQLVLYKPRNKM